MNKYNAQQLNITTLISGNDNISEYNKNIKLINSIFNNTNSNHHTYIYNRNIYNKDNKNNNYEIKKYLGEGVHGSLYIVYDKNNKPYICKKIILNEKSNINQKQQLNFELNLLNFLSANKITSKYVNPCIEHRLINNESYTIFPIFNGYSLNHIKRYLFKMSYKNYYNILFHLIKIILFGMAKIHQHNIAHQNINENSILVSTYSKQDEMKIKFTDFGLGCGINNNNNNYKNNNIIKWMSSINQCNTINKQTHPHPNPQFITTQPQSIKLTKNSIKKAADITVLTQAQNNDILSLGNIFIQLLLFFENINLDVSKGYTDNIKLQIKNLITTKFLSKLEKYRSDSSKDIDIEELSFINTNNKIKIDIIEYLSIFNDYILCEEKNIKDCQYILDKLIIYEKYKNDTF